MSAGSWSSIRTGRVTRRSRRSSRRFESPGGRPGWRPGRESRACRRWSRSTGAYRPHWRRAFDRSSRTVRRRTPRHAGNSLPSWRRTPGPARRGVSTCAPAASAKNFDAIMLHHFETSRSPLGPDPEVVARHDRILSAYGVRRTDPVLWNDRGARLQPPGAGESAVLTSHGRRRVADGAPCRWRLRMHVVLTSSEGRDRDERSFWPPRVASACRDGIRSGAARRPPPRRHRSS
jgi:hypothetical protein